MSEGLRVLDLLCLEPNWDSYGGKPIDRATLRRALNWMDAVRMVPTVDGGISFEWNSQGFSLDVTFEPANGDDPGTVGGSVQAQDGTEFEWSDEPHDPA